MNVNPLHCCIVTSAHASANATMQQCNDATIVISNRQHTKTINRRLLQQIVKELLSDLKVTKAELGIHLVGAKVMARVNWQYLQHEGSTDVITFNHREGVRRKSTADAINGELFVCVDDAVSQAREFGTTWQSEVIRYVVHGVLHLLGHDDLRPDRRRVMKREENRRLRALARKFSLAQISRRSRISA